MLLNTGEALVLQYFCTFLWIQQQAYVLITELLEVSFLMYVEFHFASWQKYQQVCLFFSMSFDHQLVILIQKREIRHKPFVDRK